MGAECKSPSIGYIEIKTMCLKTLSGSAILGLVAFCNVKTTHEGQPYKPCIFLHRLMCNKDDLLSKAAPDSAKPLRFKLLAKEGLRRLN
jgi:hypothetical protein